MTRTLARRLSELERTSRVHRRPVSSPSHSDAKARLWARTEELANSPEALRQWAELPVAEQCRRVQEVRDVLMAKAVLAQAERARTSWR